MSEMAITVKRPRSEAGAGGSLAFELFQTAYVTSDLKHATQLLGDRYGIGQWTIFDPGGGMQIGLAWVHGHQIEIIQAVGTGIALYTDWLPQTDDFAIRLHHFGYYIHDDAEWVAMEQMLEREGRPIIFGGDGGFMQFAYVDAPELGHYLEYVYPSAEGKAFFESVASN